jgi:hypothetical protein
MGTVTVLTHAQLQGFCFCEAVPRIPLDYVPQFRAGPRSARILRRNVKRLEGILQPRYVHYFSKQHLKLLLVGVLR